MNSVIENIKNGRSVRLFEQKSIPNYIINMIIEAGNLAPSTGYTMEENDEGKRRK